MTQEPFDKEELLDELDGDHEFLEESLELLAADASPLLEELRLATASGDAEAVRRAAHTLKSMVGNFCAQPAFEAAQRMEQLGADGDMKSAGEAFEPLSNEVSRLQSSLQRLLEELT